MPFGWTAAPAHPILARMAIYLVERDLPGISMTGLAAAQQAAMATAADFREHGADVDYLHSVFEPETGHCMCFFASADADVVRRVNDEARLPYRRVVEVLDLVPSRQGA